LPIARQGGVGAGEGRRAESLPYIGPGEDGVRAVGLLDRFQQKPALKETIGIGGFGLGGCGGEERRQRGRFGGRSVGPCAIGATMAEAMINNVGTP
jgi:hypothetical protein